MRGETSTTGVKKVEAEMLPPSPFSGQLEMSNAWFFHLVPEFLRVGMACFLLLSCAAQPAQSGKTNNGGRDFRNIYPNDEPGFLDFLKWRLSRLGKKIPPPEAYDFPKGKNNPLFLRSNREKTTLTWIGHAAILLQVAGTNILTDPHFSDRASPVQWAGPKRVVAPGLALEDLPPIDVVVISHEHYDSLDKHSIVELYEREGGQDTTFYVPLGLKGWFSRLGIKRVVELDWWERHVGRGPMVIAVPVHHWSQRGVFSRNKTLWAGWVVQSKDFRFFFCGDSGYSPVFKDIGQKLGPFDLAAIPIGAYEPRWFMRYHHISPEEALQVHLDIGSKKSVAIHWGTFILTDEPLDEPPKRMKKALKEKGLREGDFLILKHGETVVLDTD